jgi:hypothetical protein
MGDSLQQRLEALVELGGRRCLDRQTPLECLCACDQVAREEQSFRALVADPVRPQRGRRHAPDTRRRVADAGVVGDHEQVGAQRHVGAARDAEAVDLADDRLLAVEQAHEAAHVAAHELVIQHRVPRLRRIVVLGLVLGVLDQVVAAAEALALARQCDHMHVAVEVRLLDALGQLARHREGDAVAALRPIERDPRDPAGDLVAERLHV